MPTVDSIEQQQQLIEEALMRMRGFFDNNQDAQNLRGFFDSPLAQGLQTQLTDRASGASSPFGADLIASLIAGSTSANARGVARDSDMIRRAFANSGMSGSGLETSALVNARRGATAANTAARRDITSRAELENFQARERAQAQVQSFLQQQLQAQQQLVESQRNQTNQASQAEIGHRQQMREVSPASPTGGSGGSWVDRWNQGQMANLSSIAQGTNPHFANQHAFRVTPGGLNMPTFQQGMNQQQFAQQRLNQLIAGF